MKIKLLSTAIALFSLATAYSQQFWVVTNYSPDIYTVNVSNGSIVSSVTTSAIDIAQNPISGFQGMAEHPITGEVYVLFKDNSGDRYIGRLNTSNGEIITVALTDSNYASIAFDASGALYAKKGSDSQQMVTVNINTAPETAFHTYTNTGGGDMDAIGFNTTDNLMYRFEAGDEGGEFVSLDLDTLEETVVFTFPSGFDTWGGALAYRQGQNKFLVGAGNTLYDLLADGSVSTISSIPEFDDDDSYIKGLLKFSSSTLGINDLTKTNISIYPNPTNNIINVNLGEVNSPTNYSLYSIDGKMIGDNNTVNNNSFSIDLTDMAIGIYILKIKSENSTNTFKIIKK